MVTTRARAPSNATIAAPKTAAKSKSSAKTKKPTATPKKAQQTPKKVPNRKKLEYEDLQPETANADNLVERELLDSLKEEYESKIDKLEREYESEKRTVEKLEEENNELSSAKDDHSAQIVMLNEKINEYKKQLAENQQDNELEKFNQALQSENKRLKDEFELKNNEHMLQSATIIKVEQDLAHESIKNNELCSKITELMGQLTNREGELEARTASYKYHKEITEKLESEINELRASFANKVNEMNQLEKDLSNIKNSFNSQGVQFATLKTQFESKVNSLENQLTDANASKKKYHEALENLQKDNESLFSSTTKQINQMMADYELRLQQNSEAKYGMPELFEKLDETSKKNIQEIFKLQENINSSEKKYDSLMQKFEASQTELNSSKSKKFEPSK